jgi:hypothetical protein
VENLTIAAWPTAAMTRGTKRENDFTGRVSRVRSGQYLSGSENRHCSLIDWERLVRMLAEYLSGNWGLPFINVRLRAPMEHGRSRNNDLSAADLLADMKHTMHCIHFLTE